MPGFIDLHVHAGGPPKNSEAEYPYKLWLAHGVTTVRGVPLADFEITAQREAAQRAQRDRCAADLRLSATRPRLGHGPIGNDPAKARAWIRWAAERGVDGFKLRDPECGNPRGHRGAPGRGEQARPGLHRAPGTDLPHRRRRPAEHERAAVAARMGLGTVTHFYGHLESLLRPGEELFPPDYDYSNEQVRFSQVADWVNKIHRPGGRQWWRVPARAAPARDRVRSDVQHLRRQPRRDAHAHRRVA